MLEVGSLVDLDIADVAFDGETIAYVQGARVFVRGAIIGERVRAEITHSRKRGYLAIVCEVLEPSPTRIRHPWPLGDVNETGAANYGHMTLAGQRDMKSRMLAGQLYAAGGEKLLARFDPDMLVVRGVEDVDRAEPGWRYRSRIGVNKLATGVGMYLTQTKEHVPVDDLPLASSRMNALDIFGSAWDDDVRPGEHMRVVAPSASEPVVIVEDQVYRAPGEPAGSTIRETVSYREREYTYELAAGGFWQVHENAPDELVRCVFDSLEVTDGTDLVDLYSGAGLFSLIASDLVGPTGRVRAFEGNEIATEAALVNFAGRPWASAHATTIDERIIGDLIDGADVIIADPPRAGLGADTAKILARSEARQIALVSCDARSMARDLDALVKAGRTVVSFNALDIFPNTHFVETVCVVE